MVDRLSNMRNLDKLLDTRSDELFEIQKRLTLFTEILAIGTLIIALTSFIQLFGINFVGKEITTVGFLIIIFPIMLTVFFCVIILLVKIFKYIINPAFQNFDDKLQKLRHKK